MRELYWRLPDITNSPPTTTRHENTTLLQAIQFVVPCAQAAALGGDDCPGLFDLESVVSPWSEPARLPPSSPGVEMRQKQGEKHQYDVLQRQLQRRG